MESRQKAQAVILAGEVRANGQRADKPGAMFSGDARIELAARGARYASRAGEKLEGALQDFGVSPTNRICLDAGSSTGGFTDCLLQHGAAKVYAVDVTINQLAWKLQRDPRVAPLEMNVRYLKPENLAERPSLITADLSFISLSKVLPALAAVAQENAEFLLLIKPAIRTRTRRGGQRRNCSGAETAGTGDRTRAESGGGMRHACTGSATEPPAGCGGQPGIFPAWRSRRIAQFGSQVLR